MASVTLKNDRFPAGTSVSAYTRSDFPVVPDPPSGAPSGPVAVSTATVAADGSLVFSGLADDTKYVAYASVSSQDRYVRFRSAPSVGSTSQAARLPGVDYRARMYSTTLSNGTDTSATNKVRYTAVATMDDIVGYWGNFYNNAGVEADGLNDITIANAAIMTSGGEIIPLFFQGQRSVVLKPGALVGHDPVGLTIARGDFFYYLTYVTVGSAGQKWPTIFSVPSATGEGYGAGSDTTGTGTVATTSNFTNIYGPCQVLGRPKRSSTFTVIGGVGDSIINGTGESTVLNYGKGWLTRAINSNFLTQMVCEASDTASNWIKTAFTKSYRRRRLLATCTDIICEEGINDIGTGPSLTLAQTQARMIDVWIGLGQAGARVYQTTITPRSTSTDGWVTLANQTPTAGDTVRVPFNNWLRDGAPILAGVAVATGSNAAGTLRAGTAGHPLKGYVEVADSLESARDSGKWVVSPTARTVTDAAITASSGTLTSATANFTNADIGRSVTIQGAGASGAAFSGDIISVSSATQVALGSTAATTVSGASAQIGVTTKDGLHPAGDGAALAAQGAGITALLSTFSPAS